jgi:hypothetical protein
MKVNLTLILGLIAFAIVAYIVLMPSSPVSGVARGPLFFFETDPNAGPRMPRGGDVWQARQDLVR